MNKKKTTKKSKTTAKKRAKKKGGAKPKAETNPAEVRKEVSKLVEAEAAGMAKAVIDEAKKGQLAPTKFLFEMASIYPPTQDGTQATTEEDCLARILLDRLKLAASPGEKDCAGASEGAAEGSEPGPKDETGTKDAAEGDGDNPEGEQKPEGEREAEKEVLV